MPASLATPNRFASLGVFKFNPAGMKGKFDAVKGRIFDCALSDLAGSDRDWLFTAGRDLRL
jgi:hypothetical protein